MVNNLIEEVQTRLGLPPLQKIDPNIQEATDNHQRSQEDKLAQAAIPAAVAGIYRLTRNDKGVDLILGSASYQSWSDVLFESQKSEVVEKVAHYANADRATAESLLEKAAAQTVQVVRDDQKTSERSPKTWREFMSVQRHNVLVYLPAAMQLGTLLNDDTMDDRTNKMEGPMSNLMHKIENAMSRGES